MIIVNWFSDFGGGEDFLSLNDLSCKFLSQWTHLTYIKKNERVQTTMNNKYPDKKNIIITSWKERL